MSNKQKMITLTDVQQMMIVELREKYGLPSDTSVIYEGLRMMYQKEFPEKVTLKNNRKSNDR
jgi:hypothetical protein